MKDARMNIFGDHVLRAVIAILAIVTVVLAGPFMVSSVLEKVYDSSRESELSYTLTITSTSVLSGLTLFIPLPTDGRGISPVIHLLGTGNQSALLDRCSIAIYGANNESYLKVSTDFLPGPLNATGMMHSFTITASSPALNTRLPLRYDYTLLPKEDLTVIPCGTDQGSDQSSCFTYQSLIYASYNTSSDARVEIRADLSGTNQWKILQEYRNGYTDTLSVVLYGPVRGWHVADGIMVTSLGDDNPFWKEQAEADIRTGLTVGVDTSMMRWHTFTPLP
jgi:hypothetical protein